MKTGHAICLSLVTIAIAGGVFRSDAAAQQGQGGGAAFKVAKVNLSKIVGASKERADNQATLKSQYDALAVEERGRRQKQDELRSELNLLKPDSPQYEAANKKLSDAAIELRVWAESNQAQLGRLEKVQMKAVYDKITAAIADVASQQGIDLVVAEQPNVALDKVSVEQLHQLMVQKQVHFAKTTTDLTADVIGRLEANYNAAKK